jgi:hypothetical protein
LTFPFLSAELGPNVFFLFGIACVLASVFVAFVVVETKGRSREEIADTFTGRTNTAF